MRAIRTFFFIAFATTPSLGQLIDALFGNECLQKTVPPGMCAVIYDDDGCEGWEKPLPTGYTKLSFRYRNDAEAVIVKKGCVFTGYDHAGSSDAERGERFVLDGRNFNKPYNRWKNFDRKSLVDEISSVICECPDEVNSGSGGGGSSIGISKKIDPASNIDDSKCPTIPATACAILFDEEECESDDFEPIFLNDGEERSFSILKSILNLKYKNDIESFIVRDGCTLEAYDDSDFSDDGIRVTARNGDLLVNLDNHRNDRYEDLDNDIESVRCHCS
ncbi:unnamed protein product [Lepeophtheirus salmonis]|uniref:(salmon louse) hypothetical protein n=1 Tax=Lepeophtheirus salmonis TaxID=72036 RepID=A0A0K2V999_LEPSM|nr:unnamed protein product [Lepeophtheirus salmonis]CAF2923300.1 unnamed protein product [Lepeophtheirus salmonis]